MTTKSATMLTTGEIATSLGISRDRVLYLLRTRNIKESARVGAYRVFDAKTVERIRQIQERAQS